MKTLRVAPDVNDQDLRKIVDEVTYVINSMVDARVNKTVSEATKKHNAEMEALREEFAQRLKDVQINSVPTVDQIADALPRVSTFGPPANDLTDTEERLIVANWLHTHFARSITETK